MLQISETLNYGLDPATFINVYDPLDTFQLSDFSTKKVLLSFIEIDNGWAWLKHLTNIQADPNITSDVQIIAVIFKSTVGPMNSGTVTSKISGDTDFDSIDFTLLSNLKVTTDFLGAITSYDKYATIYGNYIHNDPLFPSTSFGNQMISYIAINDYICDKWHTGSTAAGDPISFNHIVIPVVPSFDSSDFGNTEEYVKQRLINLLADPTISYTDPVEDSIMNSSNIGSFDPITIYFSKPLISAAYNSSSYIKGGLISGSGFDITVLDPDGDGNTKSKIENLVKIQISNLDTLTNFGSVSITLNNLTDTAGNDLVDNIVNYIFNPNPVVSSVILNPHIGG